mmetsp:Transcript_36058/g.81817  ORF Transcript_36058/g.81817 Transcript_36058/m.81817 type:complete len:220 (+) Transcript_36058:819-1478(+)
MVDCVAVTVSQLDEFRARHVEELLLARCCGILHQAAELGHEVARHPVGEELLLDLVRDRRVESPGLSLQIVLVDADPLNIKVHPLPRARLRVEISSRGKSRAGVGRVHASAYKCNVEGQEERHLRNHDRPQLARQVENHLLLCKLEHEVTILIELDPLGLPEHAVGNEPVGRVVRIEASSADAKAPSLSWSSQRGWAVPALFGTIPPHTNILVGRMNGH